MTTFATFSSNMASSVARALALGSNQGAGLRTHSVARTHVSLMPATRHSSRELNGTDSRSSGGFDLGAVASGDHALVGVGVSNAMIR
jgi:hypothetical protein